MAGVFLLSWVLICLVSNGCGGCNENPESGNYNIILISLDTLRQDRLGCYGCPRPLSENLDRLAAGGVRFENAYSCAPWTLPSHASLFTALYPAAHGVEKMGLALSETEVTLAEILKSNQYKTAGFCGGYLVDRAHGFSQGFDVYRDDLTVRLDEILPPALTWIK